MDEEKKKLRRYTILAAFMVGLCIGAVFGTLIMAIYQYSAQLAPFRPMKETWSVSIFMKNNTIYVPPNSSVKKEFDIKSNYYRDFYVKLNVGPFIEVTPVNSTPPVVRILDRDGKRSIHEDDRVLVEREKDNVLYLEVDGKNATFESSYVDIWIFAYYHIEDVNYFDSTRVRIKLEGR